MGLTIEIVTSILLILSPGLALDYAAHIGVAYICSRGETRHGKEIRDLRDIWEQSLYTTQATVNFLKNIDHYEAY